MKVSSHPTQVTKYIYMCVCVCVCVCTTIFHSEERPLLSSQVPGEIEYSFMILQHRYGIIEQSLPF
jgi:hypothetical protein